MNIRDLKVGDALRKKVTGLAPEHVRLDPATYFAERLRPEVQGMFSLGAKGAAYRCTNEAEGVVLIERTA